MRRRQTLVSDRRSSGIGLNRIIFPECCRGITEFPSLFAILADARFGGDGITSPFGEGPMRKLLLAVSALATFAAIDVAGAADMALKAPLPPPADIWDGWYVGLNVGGSFGRVHDTTNDGVPPLLFYSASSKLNGVIGGEQVGYNWHSGNWLLGLEADIQGSSERGTVTTNIPPGTGFGGTLAGTLGGNSTLSDQEKLPWFGTVRARAGVLATPTWLLYVTGGLAYGEIQSNETFTVGVAPGAVVIGATTATANFNTTRAGYAAGGGVEGVVSGNWTVKLEYLFMDFGKFTNNNLAPITQSTHVNDNIVRVGLNYHLH
jgi:outer membrane immunogenic protein